METDERDRVKFVTLPCRLLFSNIKEPLIFIDFLSRPEEMSLHRSLSKMASTFLSSVERSGLIWMLGGRD